MTTATPPTPAVIEAVAEEIWFQVVGSQVPGLTWELCAHETKAWFRGVAEKVLAKAELAKAEGTLKA